MTHERSATSLSYLRGGEAREGCMRGADQGRHALPPCMHTYARPQSVGGWCAFFTHSRYHSPCNHSEAFFTHSISLTMQPLRGILHSRDITHHATTQRHSSLTRYHSPCNHSEAFFTHSISLTMQPLRGILHSLRYHSPCNHSEAFFTHSISLTMQPLRGTLDEHGLRNSPLE
jgi:hypothetical protein